MSGPGPAGPSPLEAAVFDRMPDGVAVYDAGGRVLYVNAAAERAFGRGRAELLGRAVWGLVPGAAGGPFGEAFRRVAAGGEAEAIERRDGGGRWLEERLLPAPGGVCVIGRDVTAERLAGLERRAADARFRQLYDSGVIGIAFWAPDGRLTDANETFLRAIGYEREDLRAGRVRWQDLTAPGHEAADARALAEVAESGSCAPYEKEYLHRSGRRVPVLLAGSRPGGTESEGVIWALDVSARKRVDERQGLLVGAGRLLSSSLDYREAIGNVARLAVESFATAVLVDLLDDDAFGEQFVVAHREPARAALGDRVRRGRPPGPDDVASVVARTGAARLVSFGPGQEADGGAGGVRRLVEALGLRSVIVAPLAARGRVLGVLALGTAEREYDAEDLAAAEELGRRAGAAIDTARLLEQAQAERARAEEASRAKDEFLNVVSHELRTPLQVILGWSRLLQTEALAGARRAHALAMIERSARAQGRLVETLLDVGRIVAGKVRLGLGPVDLRGVAEAAVEAARPAAEAKGVALGVTAPAAGEARALGDAERLRQAVWNLLSNAVRHTPGGGQVRVRVRRNKAHVELRVEDTGEGIAPEFLPHAFERFRQAEPSMTRRHGGLGLGLAFVKHVAELHGGSVAARSEGPGRGATFVIRLPATPPGAIEPASTPAPPSEAIAGPSTTPPPEAFAGPSPPPPPEAFAAEHLLATLHPPPDRPAASNDVEPSATAAPVGFRPNAPAAPAPARADASAPGGNAPAAPATAQAAAAAPGGDAPGPAEPPRARPAPPPDATVGSQPPPAAAPQHLLGGLRLLAVEDDEDTRDLLCSALAGYGIAVDAASSAEEALALLDGAAYDAIVSDIGLPGIDGHAFLRRVRARPADRGGRTPAVALTAFAGLDDRVQALRAGYQVHVPKPVDPTELVDVLASIATRDRGPAG